MPVRDDLGTARSRLASAAWATVAVAVCSLMLEYVRSSTILIVGNLVLAAVAVPIARLARRERLRSHTLIDGLGALLVGMLGGITLVAFSIHEDTSLVLMLVLQFLAAGALFFSTRWLAFYLAVMLSATGVTFALTGTSRDLVLLATTAVLSMTVHLALRDRQRRRDSRHAEQLEAALELAHRQLREKEHAEREREAAIEASERFQAQLLQSQKMEAIGTLAGGVAHDMNNALSGIMGFAECLVADAPNPQVRHDAEQILEAAQRAADLTRNLLGFSRRGQYRRERLRVESVIDPLVALLGRTLPKGIRVETHRVGDIELFDGDPSLISHALVNLAINASDAMAGQGVLTISAEMTACDETTASRLEVAPGPYVMISVRDTGAGIDEATRARIFEPFFTTKEAGRGTGLGLAMVYGTMKRHDGAIDVVSTLGHGTTMRLYFPIAEGAQPVISRTRSKPLAPLVGRRILVVDDEPLVRSAVKRTLDASGYEVLLAEDGIAGLEVLARERGAVDLVLLDMAMPRLDGPAMFARARSLYPELRVLLTSGFTSSEASRPLLEGGALGLVAKPVRPAQLVEAVSYAIRGLDVRTVPNQQRQLG